jgi:hypothetical protein
VPTIKIRAGLWEIQGKRCFYCARWVMERQGQVYHFIPWARYSDNGIEDLVVADVACNGDKESSLAADGHVTRWAAQLSSAEVAAQLADLAARIGWERHGERTVSVARGIYLGLPMSARLWLQRKEFIAVDHEALRRALVLAAAARRAAEDFLEERLARARVAAEANDRARALTLLAEALHPMQDSTSPTHVDTQSRCRVWNPLWQWGHSPNESIGNKIANDLWLLDPGVRSRLGERMVNAYRRVFGPR